jgi:hypothetical protein
LVGTGRQVIAAGAAAVAMVGVVATIDNALAALVVGLAAGGLVYLGLLALLRSSELSELWAQVRRSGASPDQLDLP